MSDFVSIADHLSRVAIEEPCQAALITRNRTISFAELAAESNVCARGLQCIGLRRGMRTILMVQPSAEFLIVTFALIKIGAVLVLVDPGMGRSKLKKCLAESEAEAFIGITAAHLARVVLGWGKDTVRTCVTLGSLPIFGASSYKRLMRWGRTEEGLRLDPIAPDDPAAIVFTSGSTGSPKGVLYTHQMFCSQATLLQDQFQIAPGEVDLATFPLFALFNPAMQVTTVFPQMDFSRPGRVDPRKIIEPINFHRVTHMFGSPTLLDRVGRYAAERTIKLPSLRRVLSAGAPVSPRILERFQRLLTRDVVVHTPYGATEALPVCSISSREILDETGKKPEKGVCVGRVLEGVNMAIIKITDESIDRWSEDLRVSQGEIGELVVWGPNVSSTYLGRSEANKQAKIYGDETRVRHRMGDLGYQDKKGRIWLCGRKSQRVEVGHKMLFTIPCEGIFNQHSEVRRTAMVGIGSRPNQLPVLCVELEDSKKWKGSQRLREEILDLGTVYSQTRPIRTLLFHRIFPVDVRHNAKIFREQLAVWAEGQLTKSSFGQRSGKN